MPYTEKEKQSAVVFHSVGLGSMLTQVTRIIHRTVLCGTNFGNLNQPIRTMTESSPNFAAPARIGQYWRPFVHTYLRVGDVSKITIRGLEDTDYLDTVGEHTNRRQTGAIRIDREVDRYYDSTEPVRLEDPVKNRTILVEKEGSPSTVVWNPWTQKAAALGDLPNEDYLGFACIEAAITNDRAVALAKGETHRFSTQISVK